ncbi:MaoC family dehydratase N-terminal domain-containing protein [Microbacterium sp. SSW1-49]|uniref:MaoC family dehydratase N-terminal domain-containing protein n=1 Tax=Microbacterium croceum TaxID=2851645 RepID=A0ABT0FI17_9MICO|nr:MaoC/PaaZ C-terminal domain-containing protein [Microbacterium croceum]MCK2037698.1 MaoC family dehydratase N-terminal domain-containing protein [Microbacterium croceum]
MSYSVGDVLAERTVHLTRESLVRYAGASGDFNPIHYRDDIATAVGLPGVLAHGMLTMGIASSVLLAALDPGVRILDYGVRFTKPVVVDPVEGADVHVIATVGAVDDEAARVDLKVTFGDATVLVKAQLRIAA